MNEKFIKTFHLNRMLPCGLIFEYLAPCLTPPALLLLLLIIINISVIGGHICVALFEYYTCSYMYIYGFKGLFVHLHVCMSVHFFA